MEPRTSRSPGGGDNLYSASILALRPDTGELVWHYQTTPGDNWDYTATQHMILAELEIGGAPRKVLMQAPKNGFFYVLDRDDGRAASRPRSSPTATWASASTSQTGRPIETATARYTGDELIEVKPAPLGAHNWQPMSFNPKTGLVYIPAHEIPYFFRRDPKFQYAPGRVEHRDRPRRRPSASRASSCRGTSSRGIRSRRRRSGARSTPAPWNGGTLATAGNLVFQGTAHGTFAAYRATDGEALLEAPAGTGIVAAPDHLPRRRRAVRRR